MKNINYVKRNILIQDQNKSLGGTKNNWTLNKNHNYSNFDISSVVHLLLVVCPISISYLISEMLIFIN